MTCITPGLPCTESFPKYYVTPQEQFDLVVDGLPSLDASLGGEVSASLDEADMGACGLDTRFHVRVTELIYPGIVNAERTDLQTIEDKWLYVFLDKQLVVEAKADGPDCWAANEGEVGQRGEIFLDPGPEGGEHVYTFLLSPVMLDDQAKAQLLEGDTLDKSGVAVTTNRRNIIVPIRDPLHWAAKAHAEFYLPRLEAWKSWVQNQERQSQLFIASVLQQWVATEDDVYRVGGHLAPGEPKAWLDRYEKTELELKDAAEEAAAFVCQVVDSVAYRAIEMSGLAGDDMDRSHVFQALSCVTLRLNECEAGRQFTARLVADPDRIPAQYLFTESPRTSVADWFPSARYSWLAALGLWNDLVPVAIKRLQQQGRPVVDTIQLYLENIGIETLKGTYKIAYRNIEQGKNLTAGVKKGELARHRRTLAKLEKKAVKWGAALPTDAQRIGNAADSMHSNFAKSCGAMVTSVSGVLEIVNLGMAVADWYGSEGEWGKRVGVVGAAMDMSAFLLAIAEESFAKFGPMFKRMGGFAMIVSGLCDAMAFGQEGAESVGQHDYDSAIGSGAATVGALIGAGVGVAVLVAGTLTPVGIGIAVVGAALIAGGVISAAWLRDSPHETFAEHCFLGEHPAGASAGDDARTLYDLLSHFELSRAGDNRAVYLKPGAVDDKCVFEVIVKHEFGNPRLDPNVEATLRVYLDSDEIELASGTPLKAESSVTRNADGFVTRIRIDIEPEGRRQGVHEMLWVWARLIRADGHTPAGGRWLRLDGWRQGSLPIPPERVLSSDASHVVDG